MNIIQKILYYLGVIALAVIAVAVISFAAWYEYKKLMFFTTH